ncbi:DUF692 domain-containing protein [Thermostaphylospora chromogena]|uniref:Uncharacterized protein n=1 Tax=Thermostaphylospora chromogena TaxID=35622 RepID=A0A1H1FTX4_9ACTN|nr:DUF692 domain-containing protein [Thermostaphylospora chromogena]SDR04472.1 hypothetical protein SAMN04489764_3186 [Thermostaphylospora chromogena]
MNTLPDLGVGLGYRPEIHDGLLAGIDAVDWLEVITDSYLDRPQALVALRELTGGRTVVPHGLGMSVGSESPPDEEYVDAVARLADAIDAPWVSDHLCFTREDGIDLDALTPVQRTREAARRIAAHADYVQDRLGRPFILENIAYYVDVGGPLSEAEFINEVFAHTACGLLLDLNNVMVNARNHGYDPVAFVAALPLERVVQVHLAGNAETAQIDGVLIDGHDGPVGEDVLDLLAAVLRRTTPKGVLIERDRNFPSDFGVLAAELDRVRAVLASGVA